MIIIALTHPNQLDFLKEVIDSYTQAGMPSDLLPVAADTYMAVMQAREIPVEPHLGKAQMTEVGPEGVVLEVPVEQ